MAYTFKTPSRESLRAFVQDPQTLLNFEALFEAALTLQTDLAALTATVAAGKRPLRLKSTDYVVLASESGAIFYATAADVKFTLPPTADGLWYTFVMKVPSAGTGGQVVPVAADKIMGNGFTSVDNKAAINSGATDRECDSITLAADGVDGWGITGITGTWARQA